MPSSRQSWGVISVAKWHPFQSHLETQVGEAKAGGPHTFPQAHLCCPSEHPCLRWVHHQHMQLLAPEENISPPECSTATNLVTFNFIIVFIGDELSAKESM